MRNWRKQNLDKVKEYMKRTNLRARFRAETTNGNKCVICGKVERIIFHEIHGKKHPANPACRYKYLLSHPEDFVPLCFPHHEAIHRFAKIKNNKTAQKLVKLINVES